MQQILKRLELIKTAISIEDEEIIELQVMKLGVMDCNADVQSILARIEAKEYALVVLEIEAYIKRFEGVVVYEDRELQGLRLELKVLEKKLQGLSDDKNGYLNDINEFNILYHLRLGECIGKILKLKEEILEAEVREKREAFEEHKEEYDSIKKEYQDLKREKEAKEKVLEESDEFDDAYDEIYEAYQKLQDELKEKEEELHQKRKETKEAKNVYEEDDIGQEYEEVKEDRETFDKEYEEVKQEERIELDKESKAKLKKLFRKASRLCHPDLVSEELKDQATEMSKELNNAYAQQDIKKIEEILWALESGEGFSVSSDTIEDKVLLKSKIIDIRDMIDSSEEELERIKEDEIIDILEEYEDIEVYFSMMEVSLEAEYERLKE
jgi:chromosome segregation ATPase